jgi:hypothetical protein
MGVKLMSDNIKCILVDNPSKSDKLIVAINDSRIFYGFFDNILELVNTYNKCNSIELEQNKFVGYVIISKKENTLEELYFSCSKNVCCSAIKRGLNHILDTTLKQVYTDFLSN